jgi:RNA methyltransferase, TrmH family
VPALGPRHHRVRRLRDLIRDPGARRGEGAFVVEGPRILDAALDRGAALESAYVGPGADRAFRTLTDRLRGLGIPIDELKEGVLERIGDTVTPQPVLAVASMTRVDLDALGRDGLVLVAVTVRDPGNAGTLLRSAEAAGGSGVVFCGNSVDPHAPKVVRSSAGAVFGVPVVEADDPVKVLDALGRHGRRRLAAAASGGESFDRVDLTGPVAIVLGHETGGLPAHLDPHLDARVTIPIEPPAESLNVGMAGTVLAFEAVRQRRAAP